MKFNLIIILLIVQFCEIRLDGLSTSLKGYCSVDDQDQDILNCHNFTIADINEFTFPKLRPDKIHVNLKRIHFSDSNFDTFIWKFFGYFYGSLEYISAYNCKIIDIIDESFRNVPNVTHLNLRFNVIKELRSKTFYNLKKLTDLNLANNFIKTIEPDTFQNLTRLEIIYLDNNKLKFITPNLFTMITNLKGLYLRNNPMNGELILNIQNIDELSASNCSLTKFSISVNSNEIQELLPENNNLMEVILSELKVKKLFLAHNKIKRLDQIDGSELTELYLDENPLDYDKIQNDFDNMTKLEFLSLIQTNLVKLNEEMFKSLSNLKYLIIFSNPLKESEAIEAIKEIPNLRDCKINWLNRHHY